MIYTSAVDTNKLCNPLVNNASSSKSTNTEEDSSFSNVQENSLEYCDGCVKVGNPCGHDQNFMCQRNAFRAQCQCINGFIEDKSGSLKCICPNTMVIQNEKCSCDNGHKRTPDGNCIEPVKSCPWGERIQCYKGTGQLDSTDCIPICECIEGLTVEGKCDPNNIFIYPSAYRGMNLQDSENSCIVKGQHSSLELKHVNKPCDFDKNFLCREKENEKPRCECSNGFELQMMGQSVSCSCFSPKTILGRKCDYHGAQSSKNGPEKNMTNGNELSEVKERLDRLTAQVDFLTRFLHQTQKVPPTRTDNHGSTDDRNNFE
uniref:EGF-like domain-containing protein n=1 Tax=Acrobeloides nanus TaxID=290746 RepID=A0A914CJ60_9BILA